MYLVYYTFITVSECTLCTSLHIFTGKQSAVQSWLTLPVHVYGVSPGVRRPHGRLTCSSIQVCVSAPCPVCTEVA